MSRLPFVTQKLDKQQLKQETDVIPDKETEKEKEQRRKLLQATVPLKKTKLLMRSGLIQSDKDLEVNAYEAVNDNRSIKEMSSEELSFWIQHILNNEPVLDVNPLESPWVRAGGSIDPGFSKVLLASLELSETENKPLCTSSPFDIENNLPKKLVLQALEDLKKKRISDAWRTVDKNVPPHTPGYEKN